MYTTDLTFLLKYFINVYVHICMNVYALWENDTDNTILCYLVKKKIKIVDMTVKKQLFVNLNCSLCV